jgi:hypothetical protein
VKHGILTRIKMAGDSDRGVILPVVIGLGLAMLLLVAVGMSSATSGLLKTNNDEDIKSAVAAAYAGVEDYQSRLALDSTYYKFGNPAAPFSVASAAGLTLPAVGASNYNAAFDASAGGAWANILDPTPGASVGASTGSSFRYEVDTTNYASQGIIRLLSTGRVGNVTESLVANLKQSGFIDFLYFTDFETSDPILNSATRNVTLTDGTGRNICEVHAWEVPTRSSSCPVISFVKSDELAGPVHSNDTMVICGTKFDSTVTSSQPTSPFYQKGAGCNAPAFYNQDGTTVNTAGAVAYEKSLDLPPTNAQMKKETRSDLPSDVPNPGCLYTGPTQITLLAGGKMNVISPYTKATQTTATAATSPLPAKCGTIAALQSTAGATIPVLDLNLIYVQTVPNSSSDPNYWAATATPTGLTCLSATSNDTYTGGWKFGTVQYPLPSEDLPDSSTTDTPAYSCRNGDVFVKDGPLTTDKLSGHMTIATDNYVYVTGDIKYNDPTSDILGLVGQNAVWVWNPIICATYQTSGGVTQCKTGSYQTGNNREIDSALLSVAHTFTVQNSNGGDIGLGTKGTLTVDGSITQKFRGAVASSNSAGTILTGYVKNYEYDSRFRSTAPPKFLTPTSTTYGVTQYAGTKAAYKADGTQIP